MNEDYDDHAFGRALETIMAVHDKYGTPPYALAMGFTAYYSCLAYMAVRAGAVVFGAARGPEIEGVKLYVDLYAAHDAIHPLVVV